MVQQQLGERPGGEGGWGEVPASSSEFIRLFLIAIYVGSSTFNVHIEVSAIFYYNFYLYFMSYLVAFFPILKKIYNSSPNFGRLELILSIDIDEFP